jgi:hypothetical protein
MDITVSRLNKRMALQLPAEFSLGLVFVVGTVRLAGAGNGDERLREFQLTEGDHNLR